MTPQEALEKYKIEVRTVSGPTPYMEKEWQAIGYEVSVTVKGREILRTPYRLGIGYVNPMGKIQRYLLTTEERYALEAWQRKPGVRFKDETTRTHLAAKLAKAQGVTPKALDVIHSLLMDGSAIDEPDFESWASNPGYDTDSRKAESIYRACLDIGLKLRAALGDFGLAELREAFQDY